MYELIITEKPNASKRIAEALAEGKPIKESVNGVPYYKVTHKGKDLVIGCAVGHLFGLAEKDKKPGFKYPVFDIEWIPAFEVSKKADYSKKYYTVLKKLAKNADSFTVACDYDVEGEVIGLNVVRFICNRNEARRMKFSTLTKPDVVKAYDTASSHLDWGQAEAGETRHFLDFFYGINLSRALTSAIKTAGMFKILSTGRVQAPALKIVVDREKEIKDFRPVPFWQIELNGKAKKEKIDAWHKEDKFWEKEKADAVMKNVSGEKKGSVASVDKKEFKQAPPKPFDLTSLQTESYRCFGIRPKETLALAQDLYTHGLISYPRTSSQQLPAAIGFVKILKALSKQKGYSGLCSSLLKLKDLVPNNGKKTDPAHPAIYPTGVSGAKLDGKKAKVYDLVVKRFLATFADPAVRETLTVDIHVKNEPFIAKGTRTIQRNWHVFYDPYVKLDEVELPKMAKGDEIDVAKITLHDKETQPPKRYTQSSIIKELEKRGLGTKATRADIVETLYSRHYITGESIEATDLGIHICGVLEKYIPKIVDVDLTRHFEEEMEKIRERSLKKEKVLAEAKTIVADICAELKKKEKEIGEGLRKTFTETRAALQTVGKCPKCEGMLVIKKGKFGRFVACDKYPDCTATFKLPLTGLVKVTEKVCEQCQHPMVKIIRKGKKPQEVCINPECPSKKVEVKVEEKQCPKCKEGKLVVRKSVYGAFLACNRYPKCRYTENIEGNGSGSSRSPVKKAKKKKAKKKKRAKKAKKK